MTEGVVLRLRFGSRVQTLLMRSGQSADDLAALTKLPIRRVTSILNGSYVRITIMEMETIARVLGSPLYNLLAPTEALDEIAKL